MIDNAFFKAGHPPTLLAAFFYFDMSFMVWVMLGPPGVQIAKDLHLDTGQKGLMVAVLLLAGALLRVVNGVLVDRIGPKATGLIGQTTVILGLVAAWYFGIHSFGQIRALGIAGAGNSGTVLAALFSRGLAVEFGWLNVLGLAVIPLGIALIVYIICAKDAPNSPPAKGLLAYLSVLRIGDAWWFIVPLLCDLWRFQRARIIARDLLQCRLWVDSRDGRPFHCSGRLRGLSSVLSAEHSRTGSAASARCRSCIPSPLLQSFHLPQAWMALVLFIAGMLAFGMGTVRCSNSSRSRLPVDAGPRFRRAARRRGRGDLRAHLIRSRVQHPRSREHVTSQQHLR